MTPIAPPPQPAMGFLHAYAELKAELLELLETCAGLERPGAAACRALSAKLLAGQFNIVTVGQFKRGKSCLVNALLGDALLPTSAVPLTSVATTLSHGDTLRLTVQFQDGHSQDIGREELTAYATEKGNPRNAKAVRTIHIDYPAALLQGGVRLVDTPGVGSVHQHNTDTAYATLPLCDAALFLLSADQPPGEAELAFLRDVQGHARRIFFIFNKIDYLDAAELDEALAFTRDVLAEAMGGDIRLFALSAKWALQAQAEHDADLLERSRLSALTAGLETFLQHEKGQILLLSVAGSLARTLAQAQLETRLERQSLAATPAQLDEKIALFRLRRESTQADKRRLRRHVQAEIRRVIDSVLNPDIANARRHLQAQLGRRFDDFVRAQPNLALSALDDALEAFNADAVQTAFCTWLSEEELRIGSELAGLGRTFGAQAADMIAALQHYAADLLDLPAESAAAPDAFMAESACELGFEHEPAGLEMLAEAAVTDWPAHLSDRFGKFKAALLRWANRRIVARRRGALLEAIDRQSGRARYDFLRRLEQAGARFAEDTLNRVNAAEEGMAQALAHGRTELAKGEMEAERRRRALDQLRVAQAKLGQRLAALRALAEAL